MIYYPECDHRLYQRMVWIGSLVVGLLMVAPVAYAFWTWDISTPPPPVAWSSLPPGPSFEACKTIGRCVVALIQGIDWGYEVWVIWLWLRIAAFAVGLYLIVGAILDMKLTLLPSRRKRKAKV